MDSVRLDLSTRVAAQQNGGVERTEALAQARKQLQSDQLQAAQTSQQSRSELTAASREAIARALGANTRISIERTDAQDIFVYRAIDRDTGEVINEWPPHQFAELLRSAQTEPGDQIEPVESGVIVDEKA